MLQYKVLELTKENEVEYLDQVAELEKIVLADMERLGKVGQLFITGKEDIQDYIRSTHNTVMVATNNSEKILAAAYITQGQKAFTYNDLTKYFKHGDDFKQYVRKLYKSEQEYQKDMLESYKLKIEAYKHAKKQLMEKFPEYNGDIMAFLQHELNEDGNHYHEKSSLRELVNRYMSQYVEEHSNGDKMLEEKYDRFYWTTSKEIAEEFGKKVESKDSNITELENFLDSDCNSLEYKEIIKKQKIQIYEQPNFDMSKYYTAKTNNSIELDTYITRPDNRHAGIARVLVYEGIKKHMEEHFKNPENNEIFLCSTLHRDNLSSKYVSEFFGLKDSLFVKRRDGRDREVHICKVPRESYKQYLEKMQKKLIVLYNYNPQEIEVSLEDRIKIIKEQISYESSEIQRLKLKQATDEKYTRSFSTGTKTANDLQSKHSKLMSLKSTLYELEMLAINTEKVDKGDDTREEILNTNKGVGDNDGR